MLLFINTNLKDKIYFILSEKDKENTLYKEYSCNFLNSQEILSFLDNFITLSKYTKDDFFKNIDCIVIDKGPGINMNFRIGIIVTNSLSYIYNLNIVTVEKGEYNNIDEFLEIGWARFKNKEFSKLISPEYSIKN